MAFIKVCIGKQFYNNYPHSMHVLSICAYVHCILIYLLGYSKIFTEHRRDEPVEEIACYSLLGANVLLLVSESGIGWCICNLL